MERDQLVAPSSKAERLLRLTACLSFQRSVCQSHHPPKPKGYCDARLVWPDDPQGVSRRTILQSRKAIATCSLLSRSFFLGLLRRTILQSRKAIATRGWGPQNSRPPSGRTILQSRKAIATGAEAPFLTRLPRSRTILQSRKAIATFVFSVGAACAVTVAPSSKAERLLRLLEGREGLRELSGRTIPQSRKAIATPSNGGQDSTSTYGRTIPQSRKAIATPFCESQTRDMQKVAPSPGAERLLGVVWEARRAGVRLGGFWGVARREGVC